MSADATSAFFSLHHLVTLDAVMSLVTERLFDLDGGTSYESVCVFSHLSPMLMFECE